MESGVLWRQVVTEVRDADYPDVALSHMYADAGAMQLTRWPKQLVVAWPIAFVATMVLWPASMALSGTILRPRPAVAQPTEPEPAVDGAR